MPLFQVSSDPDTREVIITGDLQLRLLDDFSVMSMLKILPRIDTFEFGDSYGQRFKLEGGLIKVIQVDPWINRDWKFGDVVCPASELAEALVKYIEAKWLKKR